MKKITKKHKIPLIILSSIILCIVLISIVIQTQNFAKISHGTWRFDATKSRLILANSILWDSGSNGSLIYENYENNFPRKIRIGFTLTSDSQKYMRIHPLFYSPSMSFKNSLNIRNLVFFVAHNVPEETQTLDNEIGMIGMDVIGNANWLIDFKSEHVSILPQNTIYKAKKKPQLTLKYNQKRMPKSDLNIANCKLENVLIDGGCDSDFVLLSSDIEKINEKFQPSDTFATSTYSLHYANHIQKNCYFYDSICINGTVFACVNIREGEVRLMGFNFFKKFEKIFLNTKRKQFDFYL